MWPTAYFLDKLDSPLIPSTSCFYGNWIEDVRIGQFIIFGNFVGCCLVSRCTATVAESPMCDSAYYAIGIVIAIFVVIIITSPWRNYLAKASFVFASARLSSNVVNTVSIVDVSSAFVFCMSSLISSFGHELRPSVVWRSAKWRYHRWHRWTVTDWYRSAKLPTSLPRRLKTVHLK